MHGETVKLNNRIIYIESWGCQPRIQRRQITRIF